MADKHEISILTFGDIPDCLNVPGGVPLGNSSDIGHLEFSSQASPEMIDWQTALALFTTQSTKSPEEVFVEYPYLVVPYMMVCGHSPSIDDVTSFKAAIQNRQIKWTLSTAAAFHWVSLVDDFLKVVSWGAVGRLADDDKIRIKIALQEAVSNAVIHGNLGLGSLNNAPFNGDLELFYREADKRLESPELANKKIEFCVEFGDRCMRLNVSDEGGYAPTSGQSELGQSETLDPHMFSGRGTFLMQANSDRFVYRERPPRVTLEYNWSDRLDAPVN